MIYSDLPTGNETILVIDDELSLMNMTKSFLEKIGYQVLTATNGTEAIEIIEQTEKTVRLILADIFLPDISGVDLINKILKNHPEMNVIFMSGQSNESIRNQLKDIPQASYIKKPFKIFELAHVLRDILDK